MQPIEASRLVWVNFPISPVPRKVNFPQEDALKGRSVTGLEAFDASQLVQAPDLTPVTPIAANYMVTLMKASDEQQYRVPLPTLIAQLNGGVWKEFVPFVVDWQRSYLENVAAIAAVEAVPFLVYYRR